jgi:hypothetical protein
MRLRKQDAAGDMQFGHNAGDFWHDQAEGVGQSAMTRLLLYRGEWFLDLTEGMPWGGFPLSDAVVQQGRVLGAHTQLSRDVAIQQRVLRTPGVQSIESYASQGDPDLRSFTAQIAIQTIYGRLGVAVSQPPAFRSGFVIVWSALGGSDPL